MTTVIVSGGDVKYEWDGSETEKEKEAIRKFGVTNASEIQTAIEWYSDLNSLESGNMSLANFERKWRRR